MIQVNLWLSFPTLHILHRRCAFDKSKGRLSMSSTLPAAPLCMWKSLSISVDFHLLAPSFQRSLILDKPSWVSTIGCHTWVWNKEENNFPHVPGSPFWGSHFLLTDYSITVRAFNWGQRSHEGLLKISILLMNTHAWQPPGLWFSDKPSWVSTICC